MRQCDWCGLITDDPRVCSWCGHVEGVATTQESAEPTPAASPNKRRLGWIATAVVVAAIMAFLLFRTSSSATAAEGPGPMDEVNTGARPLGSASTVRQVRPADFPEPGSQRDGRAGGGYEPAYEPEPEEEPLLEEEVADMLDQMTYGSVAIAGAQMASEVDEDGNETTLGMVVIVNDGDYAITDYRLTLRTGSGEQSLQPVAGTPRRIEPGEQLTVPVVATGQVSISDSVAPTVSVQATIDGPPGTATATAYVIAG